MKDAANAAAFEPDAIDIAVGHRIRVRRKHMAVTQAALAETLGLSFQQIQKYERGANRVSASMLVRIAARLDTTVGELVGETSDKSGERPNDDLFEKLATQGAVELLNVFIAVKSPALRTAILDMARALSRA